MEPRGICVCGASDFKQLTSVPGNRWVGPLYCTCCGDIYVWRPVVDEADLDYRTIPLVFKKNEQMYYWYKTGGYYFRRKS